MLIPQPKTVTPRDQKYLDWICTKPCVCCHTPAEPHHEGKHGMSIKCSDYETVPLCREHHMYRHLVGKTSFWGFWNIDPEVIIKRLNLEWGKTHDFKSN